MNPASARPRDPLLAAVRLLLTIAIGFCVVVAVVLVIVAAALVVLQGRALGPLQALTAPAAAIWGTAGAVLLFAGMFLLGVRFLRHLDCIVESVGQGDPFIPDNADRLSAMGWIAVAVQLLALPIAAIGGWVQKLWPTIHVQADLSLSGLFLALVLFVLARVFREGTRLREELEGTI